MAETDHQRVVSNGIPSASARRCSAQPPVGIELAELGRLIRERRERDHLSIRQAAAEANVSFSTLARVEAGAQPDLATFLNLSAWLGEDPGHFLRPTARRARSGLDEAAHHLVTDPRLSREAAERIVSVVRDMYAVLAGEEAEPPTLALHLRAASVMRPGVPERLAALLQDMRSALG